VWSNEIFNDSDVYQPSRAEIYILLRAICKSHRFGAKLDAALSRSRQSPKGLHGETPTRANAFAMNGRQAFINGFRGALDEG